MSFDFREQLKKIGDLFSTSSHKEDAEFESLPEPDGRTLVIAKFLFDSEPVGNDVRIIIEESSSSFMYRAKVDESGEASLEVPSGYLCEFMFGDFEQFKINVFVPIQEKPFLLGTFNWQTGEEESNF